MNLRELYLAVKKTLLRRGVDDPHSPEYDTDRSLILKGVDPTTITLKSYPIVRKKTRYDELRAYRDKIRRSVPARDIVFPVISKTVERLDRPFR